MTPNSVKNVENFLTICVASGNLHHKNCNLFLDSDVFYEKKYCLPCKKAKAALASKTRKLQKHKEFLKLKLTSTNADELKLQFWEAKNIPQYEKLVITEMLGASRHKWRKGHRYSDEWIVLCVILYLVFITGIISGIKSITNVICSI